MPEDCFPINPLLGTPEERAKAVEGYSYDGPIITNITNDTEPMTLERLHESTLRMLDLVTQYQRTEGNDLDLARGYLLKAAYAIEAAIPKGDCQ